METTEFRLGEICVRVYLQEQKRLKHSCITKAHHSMGDSSPTLGTWNTLPILQTAQQFGECPLQCFGLKPSSKQTPLVSVSSRKLVCPQILCSCLNCLRVTLISLHSLLWKERTSSLFTLEGKDLLNKVSFGDSWVILSNLPSGLRNFPAVLNVSISEPTAAQPPKD